MTADALERIFWTCVQAIVAVLLVELADLNLWWAPVAMAVLVTIKTQVAQHVGTPDAAIIPARLRTEPSADDGVDQE